MRVQAIGGNESELAIAGLRPSQGDLALEFIDPNLLPVSSGFRTLQPASRPEARVSRIRSLGTATVGRIVVLWDGTQQNVALGKRVSASSQDVGIFGGFTSTPPGSTVFGDDLIDLEPETGSGMPRGRLLVLARANGTPEYPGLVGTYQPQVTPRAAWTTFETNSYSVYQAHPGVMSDLMAFNGPVRAARDGTFVFFAGPAATTGQLHVERRMADGDLSPQGTYQSTGTMTFADIISGPSGILVLASVSSAMTFGNVTVPYMVGMGTDVVVISIRPGSTPDVVVRTWSLPSDQQPVAFAHAAGTLAILVNEASGASFWRTPLP
ncbi:MAG: hypothetical protein INH41_09090 [Myxococcaceae bacterium]|nr:hypothetical protein [Myxococcaceae bacterium]MCA3012539.1 hypothetical protein [Myxococcaceae bacterium]